MAAAPSPGTDLFRKRFQRWGWLLPAAGLAGIVIWQFWSPSPVSRLASGQFPPRFRIAQETTFITEPLDEDGYPDYEKALNQRLAKGVDPDNNRVVALLKATGPRPPGGRPFSDAFYERLRVSPPPELGDYWVPLKSFLRQDRALDEEKVEEILESFRQASESKPWKNDEHPQIAAWLEKNHLPLQTAIAASQKRDYYCPIFYVHPTSDGRGLGPSVMNPLFVCKELVSQLKCKALLAIGEGNGQAAKTHLLSGLRLNRSFPPRYPMDLHLLGSLDQMLYYIAHILLEKGLLSKTELEALAREIEEIAPWPPSAALVNQSLRLTMLDRALAMNKAGVMHDDLAIDLFSADQNQREETERIKKRIDLHAVDYNQILFNINMWVDRVVNDLQISDARLRGGALLKTRKLWQGQILVALKDLQEQSPSAGGPQDAAQAMTTFVGLNCVQMAITTSMLTQELSDDTEMRRRLLITAIALARFRQQTGAFPESLQSMTPTYLKEVPLDLHSGLLPIYVKSPEDGYLLYSIGADGIDSGGSRRSKEVNSDDIAVRVPRLGKN